MFQVFCQLGGPYQNFHISRPIISLSNLTSLSPAGLFSLAAAPAWHSLSDNKFSSVILVIVLQANTLDSASYGD